MRITKFGHACLLLEDDGHQLMIDPGGFTELPETLSGISTVVVTEEHMDHYNLDNLKKVIGQNPDVTIYTTAAVAKELAKESVQAKTITGNQEVDVDGFKLSFYETDHAPVYQKSPCRSLSVKVNDDIYYPSDSYQTIPNKVKVLALPTSGPWFKIDEGVNFLNSIQSDKVLFTHNALNSDTGNNIANHYMQTLVEDKSREFIYLSPGESTEI